MPMPFDFVTVLIILLRHILDAFGIYGFGLFIMRKKIGIVELLKLSTLTGLLIIPVRHLPIIMGSQVSLIFIIEIILLIKKGYSTLVAAGSVLLGGWLLVFLEMVTSQPEILWIENLPSHLQGVFYSLPSALILFILALAVQTLVGVPAPRKKTKESYKIEDKHRVRLIKSIPVAQLFSAMLIAMTVSSTPLYRLMPESVVRSVPLFIFGIILAGSYISEKRLNKERFFIPLDFIDLLILLPTIHFILVSSGGVQSPYKFLFIPLILTNALKPGKLFGGISVIAATLSLGILGVKANAAGGSWQIETDLIYILTFSLINWITRYFLKIENELDQLIVNRINVDEITGLYNYLYLQDYLKRNHIYKKRGYCLVVIELLNLDNLTEKTGLLTQNALLKHIADAIKQVLPPGDILARSAGNEFIIIHNLTHYGEMSLFGEKVRDKVEETYLAFINRHRINLPKNETLSVLVGITGAGPNIKDIDTLILNADRVLCRAKKETTRVAVDI